VLLAGLVSHTINFQFMRPRAVKAPTVDVTAGTPVVEGNSGATLATFTVQLSAASVSVSCPVQPKGARGSLIAGPCCRGGRSLVA
jgi:hypothetical protein